jgi:hypothetical protein
MKYLPNSPKAPVRDAISEPRGKYCVWSRCRKGPATIRFPRLIALRNASEQTPCAPVGSTGQASWPQSAVLRRQIADDPDRAPHWLPYARHSSLLRLVRTIHRAPSGGGAFAIAPDRANNSRRSGKAKSRNSPALRSDGAAGKRAETSLTPHPPRLVRCQSYDMPVEKHSGCGGPPARGRRPHPLPSLAPR